MALPGTPALSASGRRSETPILWVAAACFAFSRLYNLKGLPIFIDEAADIQKAMAMWSSKPWHVLNESLRQGKFLHVLLYSSISSWAGDPFLAARLVSAAAGAVTFACCYRIGARLSGVQAGLVAAALYVVCPFGLFYDRMAISDTILCAGAACTIVATLRLIDKPSVFRGAVLGVVLLLTALAKLTGLVAFAIPPLACMFLCGMKWPANRLRRLLFLAYGMSGTVLASIYGVSYVFASQKPLSSVLYVTVFAGSLHGFWSAFGERASTAAQWLIAYLTVPLVVAALLAVVVACKAADRKALFLASVCTMLIVCPLLATATIFPRYFVWVSSPLLVCVAMLIVRASDAVAVRLKFGRIAAWVTTAALFLLVSFQAFPLDYAFVVDCSRASLPAVDRSQYVESWPSGYGVEKAAEFIASEAKQAPEGVYVVCPQYGGNSHFGLQTLLAREKAITVEYSPLHGDADFAQLRQWRSAKPVYVVFDQPLLSENPEEQFDLRRLETDATQARVYRKPVTGRSIAVYRVAPVPAAIGRL